MSNPEQIICAIMGPTLCGKSSLARSVLRGHWVRDRLRSLAFDPWLKKNPKIWGPHAWVTDEFPKFGHVIFNVSGCAVLWDEGTHTGGRDRDNLKFFTAIRHHHRAFYYIGHGWQTMLPIMRESLSDVVLFRQTAESAQFWANHFTDEDLLRATALPQYVALHKRAFQPVRELRFTPAELAQGVTL